MLSLRRLLSVLSVFVFVVTSVSVYAAEKNKTQGAQRIVALSPHSVELLYTLGVGDRIVATSDYADYPEAAKNILRVGGYNGFNIERILETDPDLVIAWQGGNDPGDIAQLKKMGLNVYLSEPLRLEQISDELIILAKLVGEEQAGIKASEKFKQRLRNLRSQYQHREPVTFFYQLWANPLKGMAAGSWINEVLEGCGGQNVLTDKGSDYPSVSLENILMLAPQTIIQPTQHGSDQWDALNWKPWIEIPAVANKHMFSIDGDLLHRFTTRILDGMELVCERLQEVREFEKS